MKKITFLFVLIFIVQCVNGQDKNHYPFFNHNILYINTFTSFENGEKIKIGYGSRYDSSYAFIKKIKKSEHSKISIDDNEGFSKTNSNSYHKIIKIKWVMDSNRVYSYFPVIEVELVQYEIDILKALESGEVLCKGFSSQTANNKISIIPKDTIKNSEVKPILMYVNDDVKDIRYSLVDAGKELNKYYKTNLIGTLLEVGGGLFLVGCTLSANTKNNGTLAIGYLGGMVGVVGWVLRSFIAPSYINNASIIFTNAGISIPINMKIKK